MANKLHESDATGCGTSEILKRRKVSEMTKMYEQLCITHDSSKLDTANVSKFIPRSKCAEMSKAVHHLIKPSNCVDIPVKKHVTELLQASSRKIPKENSSKSDAREICKETKACEGIGRHEYKGKPLHQVGAKVTKEYPTKTANDKGLHYADLVFTQMQQSTQNASLVIHGKNNRSDYDQVNFVSKQS